MEKSPIAKRIMRLLKMLWWLGGATRAISRLHRAGQSERNLALGRLGEKALNALGVELEVRGRGSLPDGRSLLVVANHVSILDIFALSAAVPTGFIAKREIRSWPLIGRLVANVGTVFIDRTSRKDTDTVVQAVNRALEHGSSVCFFPESKTSEGLSLLPFKAALFQSSVDTGAPVLPVVLRYYGADGMRTAEPSYAGDISLMASLWKIVSMEKLRLSVDILPVMEESDRFTLKERAWQEIADLVSEDSPSV